MRLSQEVIENLAVQLSVNRVGSACESGFVLPLALGDASAFSAADAECC